MRSVTEGHRQADDIKPGSDRNFGLVMAAAAAILGALPLLRGGTPHWYLLGGAAAFAILAFAVPRALFPLNYLWFRFGLLLHRVISPIVIGAVFFLCVTPTGVIMRWLGKDLMQLRRRDDLSSYWIMRDPPGPAPGTMTDQF
ncbi:MAG TPA: SxtJ family membrane protein [Xanthobacteraceae bacterium]|nr:SxtJ family membrane protein [Xanthobacteraceae bacterium]